MSPDFDFKIGQRCYRGRGMPALVALAIVHLPRAALYATGGVTAHAILLWLLQAARVYIGH